MRFDMLSTKCLGNDVLFDNKSGLNAEIPSAA